MATRTVCTTAYREAPIDPWSPAARVEQPLLAGQIIEFHVAAGDSVALAVTASERSSAAMDDFLRRGDSFLRISSTESTTTLQLVEVASGGNNTVWSTTHTNIDSTVGGWVRIVRSTDGRRWGVHTLHTPLDTTQTGRTVFPAGDAVYSECDIAWAPTSLASGDAWVFGWLRGASDALVTTTSGLTGTQNPADADYLSPQVDVTTTGQSFSAGRAWPALTLVSEPSLGNPGIVPGRTRTRGVALENGTAVGRTLTRAGRIRQLEARGRTLSRAPTVHVGRASAATLSQATATRASSANIPLSFDVKLSDEALAGGRISLPQIEVSIEGTLLDVPTAPEGAFFALRPITVYGHIKRIKPGGAEFELPGTVVRGGDYAFGGAEISIPQIRLGISGPLPAGQANAWRERTIAEDSWQMSLVLDTTISEELSVDDEVSIDRRDDVAPTEEASAEDSWTVTVDAAATVEEVVEVADQMTFSVAGQLGSDLSVWSLNLDTRASSQYENYGFNSFFQHEGLWYGVADDGVYRLDGDSDAGEDIQSSLYVVQTDFDSDRVKYVPKVYFGGTSSRPIRVVMGVDGVDRTYEARNWSANLDVHRIDCGAGVKGNYWSVTLQNYRGADFELDSVRMTPTVIKRRI